MPDENLNAFIEPEKGPKLHCLFNPEQFQLSQSNAWKADPAPGKDTPKLSFTGGQSGSMSLELFFDTTYEAGVAVTKYTNQLLGLMDVDPSLSDHDDATNRGRPPWVKFHWGGFHSWKAIIASLNITYTFFSGDGVPERAKVSITLTQYDDDSSWGPQNPTSGTPHPHRTHAVKPGETLDRIAALHYGDSTLWRALAKANHIENPLGVPTGTVLSIPHKGEMT